MPARRLKYAWQQEFRAALLELKPADLMRRITEAEAAVFDRFQKISKGSEHIQERTALEDALRTLGWLRKEASCSEPRP